MRRKEMAEIIKKVTDPSMTRMEAWEATQSAGLPISWETFKLAMWLKLEFKKF